MSVRSAQSITVLFSTSDFATGAATNADSTPTGTLYLNGTSNGATVTVTNISTGLYKAAVTLPTLAVNDVVDLQISATVDSVAAKAVVWRDTKDVFAGAIPDVAAGATNGLPLAVDGSGRVDVLKINGTNQTARDIGASVLLSPGTGTGQISLSSGAVTFSNTSIATVTNLTNLPAITAGWLTASGIAADAITAAKIADGAIDAATFASGALDAVWSTAARTLTAGTNIVLAKGTGITGFNDIAATDVVSNGAITTSSGAVSTVTTTTTATNLTNLPTIPNNWLTAAGIASAALNGKGDWNVGKTGYTLTQSFPTNFADLAITASTGRVTVGTNADKTGYTVSTVSDKTGYSLAADQHVIVDSGTVTTLTNLPAITTDWLTGTGVAASAVTKIQNGLATPTNITAGTITTVTNLTNAPTSGDFTATMKASITTAATAATPTVSVGDVTLAASQPNYAPQKAGVAVTLPSPAPTGYGGGESTGDGAIAVNHDTGGTDNLRATVNGSGLDNVIVRAYLTSEYDAGGRTVRGRVLTTVTGRWATDMMLDAGEYTFTFSKDGYVLTTTEVTVA